MQTVSTFVLVFGNSVSFAHVVHENIAPYVFEFYMIPLLQLNSVVIG